MTPSRAATRLPAPGPCWLGVGDSHPRSASTKARAKTSIGMRRFANGGVRGGHGRGGLLVQESNEAPPNGTRGVTECAGHDETDEVGMRVEPEVVLPAQVFDRRADLQPEKRLMLAILEDATATLPRHPTARHAGTPRALPETEC